MKRLIPMIILVILSLLQFRACASRNSDINTAPSTDQIEYETTSSGYLLNEGIPCEVDGWLVYETISYDGEYTSLINEAESLVRKWWNDDKTFHRPDVVWVKILAGEVRGFQADGYLFLDPDTEDREDLLATIVHEWLHDLVDEYTLIDEVGTGRPIMEMVVESITVDILGNVEVPTDNYVYFKNNQKLWLHKKELQAAFRNQEDFSAYKRIFGKNYMEIIIKAEEDLS